MKMIRFDNARLAGRCKECAMFWGSVRNCHARLIAPSLCCPLWMESDGGEIVAMDASFYAMAAPPRKERSKGQAKTHEQNKDASRGDMEGLWTQ